MATSKTEPLNAAVLSIGLLALLEKIPDHAGKQEVHRLRTTVRRLEVHLDNCPGKVAKSLKSLRKKAGKVRDIDVHLGLIKPALFLKKSGTRTTPESQDQQKAQDELREVLETRRERKLEPLLGAVSKATPLLHAKLPLLAEEASRDSASAEQAQQKTERACQQFLRWTRRVPEDPERLHQLRIQTKGLRYSLEPLEQYEESAEVASQFKRVQDAIGNWHDWATLAQLAQKKLRSSGADAVCSVLQARAGREYQKSRRTAENARAWMNARKAPKTAETGTQSLRLVRKAG